ncbi:dihydrofolate reductase family protein [Streptosporangium carneum]|uniref:Deaminase n=1 Tax=Streptosporangium carneum TaxID=47481 RepID=A0A9W6MAX3_9ACTN|nr:dihydrofolate reductase family protein [Streptosporangium carneum]GLK07526.1 deaminase [Streptosporangium carneum]
MRKLVYYVGSSIDGFIAGPDGSVDFFPMGDDILEHILAEYADAVPTHVRKAIGIDPPTTRFDTVVMGRATYDPALREGITSPYGHLRQYVVSGSVTEAPDPAVRIVSGDPVAAVRELKRQDGKGIWLAGGARLAGTLLPEIDELIVKVYPVIVGSGIPLFAGGFAPTQFELADSRVFGSGAAVMTYTARPS